MKRKPRKHVGYWSFNRGLGEPTTEDRLEIEARTAEVLAKKLEAPKKILGVPLHRTATGVYRSMGNGAHRRTKRVSNY